MGRLVMRRLLATIPVLFLVTLGVFLLIHLTPGDPVETMLGESQDSSAKEALRHELGLDHRCQSRTSRGSVTCCRATSDARSARTFRWLKTLGAASLRVWSLP